jgi:hypothetical protein
MQYKTELQPELVERAEDPRVKEAGEQEGHSSQETPPPHRSLSKQGDRRKEEEHGRHDQGEGPVRRALGVIVAPTAFVRGWRRSGAQHTGMLAQARLVDKLESWPMLEDHRRGGKREK